MQQKCDCGKHHLTVEEYMKLSAYNKGYAIYIQASHPGSPLKDHQENPYPECMPITRKAWFAGNQAAMLDVQDSEE